MKIFKMSPVRVVLLFILTMLNTAAFSENRYLLCGSDEDACQEGRYQYCACIPYNEAAGETKYCFDFDAFTCRPLALSPHCDPNLVYQNQATCLAMIYHSDASNPCSLTTESFCAENVGYFCNEDGFPWSCEKRKS